ncbi:DNA-3-methyladenine glycosylase family protein [Acidihalobacter yilgarnensis]|nr:DNA-3-methyladenine glycosylase 2 family protein [Acidihalobacter yilgarnensis]
MAHLQTALGPCRLSVRPDPFVTLCASIIGQQLSTRAAGTIRARLETLLGGPPTAVSLVAADVEALRGAGLSGGKVRYLQEIATRSLDGRLDFTALWTLPDTDALACLTEVPGIGRWTAEMFLIFGLGRLDVFAPGDAGLRRAIRTLYGDDAPPDAVSALWAPYRSVASWYLWQHIDTD